MSTTPVPRLVGAMWYPVPCPEGVPLTLGFPSEEACASFCEAVEPMLDAWEVEWSKRQDELFDEMSKAESAADDAGYDRGFDDHAIEGCGLETCECFGRGHVAGYEQAEKDLVPSAESA